MSRFTQLHLLTSYPPSNPNRDDLGRPKTAWMGGVSRLRISSQSLKRAWRTSEVFESALGAHRGVRTKRIGREVYDTLTTAGITPEQALEWSRSVAAQFGKVKGAKVPKLKKGDERTEQQLLDLLDIEQLAHLSVEEREGVAQLTSLLAAEQRGPSDDELNLLRHPRATVDVALFGRMLAADPLYNVEAACQVAHAISVHPVVVEDDYFTAVDDLNTGETDRGAAHIGEAGFAAALFYSYVCIDREQLTDNLGGDRDLAGKTVGALIEAAATVAPSGKQNSFANRVRASYALAERGDQQPRSLSVAFLKPIERGDYGTGAVGALETARDRIDQVYGACADTSYSFNAFDGTGTLADLLTFVRG